MNLESGYYKLKRGNSIFATYHFLRVFTKDRKKFFQLDHGCEEAVHKNTARDMHDGGYQIIKKYTLLKPPQYNKIKAKIEFEDEEGCKFEMTARSGVVLESIFEMFPRLKRQFWT